MRPTPPPHPLRHLLRLTVPLWLALPILAAAEAIPPESSAPPAAAFNVRSFGATGDGLTKDTVAFQKALDACAVAGGGDVIVPAGDYLIGSVQMGTRTILRLEKDSVITGSPDLADYPMMEIRWEGRWQQGHRALIYSANVDHTGIVGPGRIEGDPTVAAPQNPRGAVVLEPISCNDPRWEGFTVTQGGNWATHPTYCSDVTIKDVTITGNRDGIDIDSCQGVRIEGCNVDTGDDAISLKSGRGMDGARIGKPTEDVLITHCTLQGPIFACIGIGSETSGGIRNVRIEHTQFTSSRTSAIYIKTRIGRAGTIENISGDDLDVLAGGFLQINLTTSGNANTVDDSVAGLAGYPLGRNFKFSNVRVACTTLVDVTKISAEKPLQGLSLTNITGTCTKGISLANVTGAELKDIKVTGFTGPLLATDNATGTGLEGAAKYTPPPARPARGPRAGIPAAPPMPVAPPPAAAQPN
jgi:polygalacturonase